MAQNIYDKPDFFAGYSRLPRSVHGLNGAPEWPAIRRLLPDLNGKRIVDFGCGFGWFARWVRGQGVAYVLGLDLSENMIGRARAETKDSAIEYRIADLERVELPTASCDFAFSALAFHYIEDFDRLVRMIYRALAPEAHFVFTIEHPIYMAPTHPGWAADRDGRATWPVNRYAIEGPRVTDWLAPGVIKHHRTMGTTLNTLIGAGFAIRHVEEWRPTDSQVVAQAELTEELERPIFLILAAQR